MKKNIQSAASKPKPKISDPQSLRVLMVEDSEDDALLIIRELKKGDYNPVYERVETAAAMKKALKEKQWDIILCDYKLPKFNAPSSIAILKETDIDIPLIIVSGTIGEETSVECMRLGAHDYIMKNNLSRLVSAIERELKETESRVLRKRAEEALRQSDEKYRTILDNIEDGYYEADLAGNLTFFNDSLCRISGYSREESMGINNRQYTTKETSEKMFQVFNEVYRTEKPATGYDYEIIRKDGTKCYVEASIALRKDEAGKKIGFRGITRDITERRRAEKALKESENKYRLLANNVDDVLFVLDMNLNYTYASPSVKTLMGYEPEELLNLRFSETVTSSSCDMALRNFSEIMELEISGHREIDKPQVVQLEMKRKDGGTVWTEAKTSFIRDENQRPVGVISVSRDITERKKAEDALRKSEEKYRTILETMQEGYFEVDLSGNFTFVNDASCRHIGYTKEEMIGTNSKHFQDETTAEKMFQLCLDIYRTGEPITATEAVWIKRDGTKGTYEASMSLISDSKGNPIGFRGISRNITERKKTEEALRQSEEKYRTILEDMEEGYFEIDLAGNYTFANEANCRYLGYTKEELIGISYQRHTNEETAKKLYQLYYELYRTGKPIDALEVESIRKDGTKAIHETSVFLIKDAKGKPTGFRGVSRDITERKRAEAQREAALEELRRSEERYRTIIENIEDGYFEIDLAGNFTFVNDAECRNAGIPREQLLGMNNRAYTNEEDAKRLYQLFSGIYRTGEPVKGFAFGFERGDGTTAFNELTASLMRDAQGKPIGFRGISRDITERKQAEESLRESEERYKALFDRSLDLVYITDFEGRFLDANDAALNRLGYTREEILSLNFTSLLSEDQLPLALKAIQEMRKTGIQMGLMEFRLRHKNGSDVYVETRGSTIISNGTPVAIQAIARDITERKQMDEALRQSEEKYRTIIEKMEDGYYETDLAGNFTFFNDSLCKIHGYPRKELMGMNDKQYADEENAKKVFKFFNKIYRTGEYGKIFDNEIIRKDGTKRQIEVSGSLKKDSLGNPTGFKGITRDITERKQAEEERKQSFERMRKALGATVHSISVIVEMKDPYTSGHQQRVSDLARSIATEMGLSADQRDFIRVASTIHDIGKISIPSEILSKPTKLTDLEFNLIKTHAQSGYDILKDIEFPWPVADVVLQHHERMDGSGYPQGIKGDDILLEARILAIADVVEAIASHRPYRPSRGIDFALEEISENKGILYDTDAVDACLRLFREKGYILVLKKS